MNDSENNPNDPLEQSLRRWGAQEAARSAEVPPAPAPPHRGVGAGLVLRWAPLAAAAVLLIAAGWLFQASRSGPVPEPAGGPIIDDVAVVPPPVATTQPDSKELKLLREENQELRDKLDQAKKQLIAFSAPFQEQIAELKASLEGETSRHKTDVQELAASLRVQQDRADTQTKANEALGEKLATAEQRIAALEKEKGPLLAAAEELPALKTRMDSVQQRLAAAAEELKRARTSYEQAEAAADQAQRRLLAWQAQRTQLALAFQQMYAASIDSGDGGLSARQAAARRRRLVDRLPLLLPQAGSEQTRRLMGRLDVVLTRLDLLDANQPKAVESFRRLLAQGDYSGQIDRAIASTDEPAAVQTWLFEAKLVLTGAGSTT